MVASSDLIVEIGHSFMHAPDYLSGKTAVHSHNIGKEVIVHNHKVLNKIQKALDTIDESNSDQRQQNAQLFTFDQLKIIVQELNGLPNCSSHESTNYNYLMKPNQVFNRLATPPPQNEIV